MHRSAFMCAGQSDIIAMFYVFCGSHCE